MRLVLAMAAAAAMVLGACSSNRSDDGCDYDGVHYAVGAQFPEAAPQQCNTCTCEADGEVACTDVDCVPMYDANPASCETSGHCSVGVDCNGFCCGPGEVCSNGTTCMCGSGAACTDGNTCNSALPEINSCGDICCGKTMACPG